MIHHYSIYAQYALCVYHQTISLYRKVSTFDGFVVPDRWKHLCKISWVKELCLHRLHRLHGLHRPASKVGQSQLCADSVLMVLAVQNHHVQRKFICKWWVFQNLTTKIHKVYLAWAETR